MQHYKNLEACPEYRMNHIKENKSQKRKLFRICFLIPAVAILRK